MVRQVIVSVLFWELRDGLFLHLKVRLLSGLECENGTRYFGLAKGPSA